MESRNISHFKVIDPSLKEPDEEGEDDVEISMSEANTPGVIAIPAPPTNSTNQLLR